MPPKPTAQVGKIPPERWVWGARCLPLPPTAQVGSTPYKGWAHLHGGHSPFSPQLKTNFAPPCPSLPPLLAVVTAMHIATIRDTTMVSSRNGAILSVVAGAHCRMWAVGRVIIVGHWRGTGGALPRNKINKVRQWGIPANNTIASGVGRRVERVKVIFKYRVQSTKYRIQSTE